MTIDEYLRRRLMPVEGAIPHLPGVDMYGNTVPVAMVGGDLFEYINFEQRYNIQARIAQAEGLAKQYLDAFSPEAASRNEVDMHVSWLSSQTGYAEADALEYRRAKSSEQDCVHCT
jgi:hypothetical protein